MPCRRCPPRLRRPRRQCCRPRRRSRSTWCSAWGWRRCASPTRSCCRSCAALAATRATRWRPGRRLGTADWRARCLDVGDAATAPVRAGVRFVLSPHLGVRKKMQRPRLIAVLRPPLERLVAEFNARPLRDWRLAASDYSRAGAAREAAGSSRSITFAPTPRASRPQRSLVRARRHTPHRLHVGAAEARSRRSRRRRGGGGGGRWYSGVGAATAGDVGAVGGGGAATARSCERGCPPRAF